MVTLKHLDSKASDENSFIDQTHDFRYNGLVFYFGKLHSSLVKRISRVDNILIVETKNSTYTFEDVK